MECKSNHSLGKPSSKDGRISMLPRATIRTLLHRGFKATGFVFAGVMLTNTVYGQLRTGRDTDREFYSPTESVAAPKKASRTVEATESKVVQASATSVPQTKANTAARVSSTKSKPDTSRVVQAACKNCQAGIAHSHGPIESNHESSIVIGGESAIEYEGQEESYEYIEPRPHGRTRRVSQSCGSCGECDACNAGCQVGFLGTLLRQTQFKIEAATYWPKGQNLPILVTTRRPADDPATDGLIGDADTINLFGGNEVLGQARQGLRGELGMFLDPEKSHGVLLRFFDAGSETLTYGSTPGSEPVVMRPFFSTASNAQSTIAINYPGSTSGSLNASVSSEVYGGDLMFRKRLAQDCMGHIELLAGYQTARLADSLSISSSSTALTSTPAPAGTISQITDTFGTVNRFNGFGLGLNGIMRDRNWSLAGMVKLGFGTMERSVSIDGSSSITVPGNPASVSTSSSGLLARNTNEGNYLSNTSVVSPEVALTLGYRITRGLEATFGYTYLGLPKVARVSDQLDPNLAVNLSNPPTGVTRPSFELLESNFSLHSLNYGLQWNY